MIRQARLEEQLNSFDSRERRDALDRLAAEATSSVQSAGTNFNMHLHSFFSFNAEDFSPSRLAWEARKAGLYAVGLCDFDVLDGLEEFLDAGLTLGLRTTVNIETRAYLKAYANAEISSPGEPGVTYVMGAGFARAPAAGSSQGDGLRGYRDRARGRNEALIRRVNIHLPDVAVDYARDVLPLTPGGTATERHIVRAYVSKAQEVFQHPDKVAEFWSKLLDTDFEQVVALLVDVPALEELVRSRLVKKGGLGYEQPSAETFPPVEEFVRWVASCDAVPMITWLDGTSDGEKDGRALLECMAGLGACALNIIPDRNWNVADPKKRAVKQANLATIVEAADSMALPINIGTEMNKLGLPFVDDLAGDALRPFKETFTRGARIMVGHTLLLRYARYSYVGEAARNDFRDVRARNAFFERVGAMPPLSRARALELEAMGPERALEWFRSTAGAASVA